ncbi:MAG: leucyl aminopeptidase [Burkholderiales bacterium]|nr:leucyl aminopeptidase [Burkholderiales bacterium]
MNVQATVVGTADLAGVETDILVLVLSATHKVNARATVAEQLFHAAFKSGDLEAKGGQSLYLHGAAGLSARRVLLVVARDGSVKAFRQAMDGALAALKSRGLKSMAVAALGFALDEGHAEALCLSLEQSFYVYRHTKPSAEALQAPAKVQLCVPAEQQAGAKAGLRRGRAVAAGVGVARECANRPGNACTPTWLGEEARRIGSDHGLSVKVLDRKEIEKIGMGSFLSVSRGSDEPPRFIIMEYRGGAAKAAPVVLVGKGITFDTGGISLKPAPEMDEMKFDMGGAASVLGTMRAIGELKPKLNVVALIPTCENMPSGRATKPGDVVTSLSGQTIEILNTDAEGRLILCDALTYAARYKPAAIVDVATLTGACVIALGHHHAGLFASDDALAAQLLAAAGSALDPAWRMPLDDEYAEGLKSRFADVANVGGRPGGSITAAKFLHRFVGSTPWAHLDIAGVAYKGGATKGATGRPVGLLTHFLLSRAAG